MAVGQGFEPWELLHSTVFKTAAFDHSATPPEEAQIIHSFAPGTSRSTKKINRWLYLPQIAQISICCCCAGRLPVVREV